MPGRETPESSPVRRLVALDRTVHEPARLAVLLLLGVVERADFLFILDETGMGKANPGRFDLGIGGSFRSTKAVPMRTP